MEYNFGTSTLSQVFGGNIETKYTYIIVKLYVGSRYMYKYDFIKRLTPLWHSATEAKPCCSRLENQVIFLARDPSLRWLFHPQVWPLLTIRFIRQPLGCHTTEVRRHYTIWFCWMVGTLMFNTYPYDLNFWIMLPRFYVLKLCFDTNYRIL